MEKQLKTTLDEGKVKNHQQGMRFKRELEDILQEFEKRNDDLQAIVREKNSAILWAVETFSSSFGNEMVKYFTAPRNLDNLVRCMQDYFIHYI